MIGIENSRENNGHATAGIARTGILAVALIIFLGLLFFFKESAVRPPGRPVKGTEPITIGLNKSLKSTPFVVAEQRDFFEREGLAVKLVAASSSAPLLDMLGAGQLDIACAPEQLIAFLAMDRDDFRILVVLNRSRTQELIINSAGGVYSPFGLKGRRIGLKMDSAAPYFLYRKLLYHNIALDDVVLVDMEPEMIADRIAAGAVDAAVAWPPYSYQVRQRLGKNALVANVHIGRDMYWVMVARAHWCRENMNVTGSLLKGLQAAFDHIHDDPGQAMTVAADYFGFSAEAVRREWGVHHFELELPQSLLFAMEQAVEWRWKQSEEAGTMPDFLSMVEYRPMEKLFPGKVTIIR